MNSSTIILAYDYGIIGTRDGNYLTGSNTDLKVAIFFPPLGTLEVVDANNRLAPGSQVPGPLEKQGFIILTEIELDPFNQSLKYDPGVALQLLFNPEPPVPSSTPDISQADLTPGVIAAIAIVCIVGVGAGIAGAIFYAVKVMPYKNKRDEAKHSVDDDELEEPKQQNGHSSRWTTAEPKSRDSK